MSVGVVIADSDCTVLLVCWFLSSLVCFCSFVWLACFVCLRLFVCLPVHYYCLWYGCAVVVVVLVLVVLVAAAAAVPRVTSCGMLHVVFLVVPCITTREAHRTLYKRTSFIARACLKFL